MRKTLTLAALLASAAPITPALAQSAASPFTSANRYDVMRRVTGTIAPDPDGAGPLHFAAVRNTYDAAGRLTKVERGQLSAWQSEAVAPANWTGFTVLQTVDTVYDRQNRKVRETLSSGGTVHSLTQTSYDIVGRPECTALRMNPAAFGAAPASACTLGTQGSFGPDRIVRNVYDNASQLVQVREAIGTGMEAAEATYSYTPNGKREYVIDGEGNRARLVYDGHDRLSQWIFPSTTRPTAFNATTQATALATAGSVNTTDYEQYGYDTRGNRNSLRKRDGQTIAFSYDALNRMTLKDLPSGSSADVYYGYDARGKQTFARFGSASGQGVTSTWDGFGQQLTSTINLGGVARTLEYEYDAAGNRIRITHPDLNYFTTDYDGLNRATAVLENGSATLVTIAYDALGRRSSLTRAGAGTTTYAYDGASRLQSLGHDFSGTTNDVAFTLGFSPASQILSRVNSNDVFVFTGNLPGAATSTINGLNQVAAHNGTSFTHDANGNFTWDGARTYTYDVENRLVSTVGDVDATLTYDPLGRLASYGTSTQNFYLYDGDERIAEYNAAGALARRYVYGPGTDEPLVSYQGANLATRSFLHADERGSIIARTDASGAVTAINRYDEYGVPASTNSGYHGYTGQMWLPELNLWHYRARIYSPHLGRFLQVDPVGYEASPNFYVYASDDPLNRTDPSGNTDINLITEYDPRTQQHVGTHFDMPGTVTILAHGREGTVLQRRSARYGDLSRIPVSDLAGRVRGVEASRGQPVALFACRAGTGYAQQLSRALGGRPVIATRGWVTSQVGRDGTITVGAIDANHNATNFEVFGGSWSSIGINVPTGFEVRGFSYNTTTGRFTVIMADENSNETRSYSIKLKGGR